MSLPNVISEINTIKSTYLPLSGGSLTGNINWNKGVIRQNGNSFEFIGDKDLPNQTSFIACRSATHPSESGWFYFGARNEESGCMGICKPDGTFTWGGKNIITSINGVNADVSGNIKIQKQFTPFSETGCSTFDDLPEGFYYINSVPEAGRPTSNWGVLRCCRNGGTPFQIYEDDISAKSWKRWFTGGAWTSWIEIPSLSSSWCSGINGYRKWNDGLIEQWGLATASHGGVINLHTSFASTNYCVYMLCENVDSHWMFAAYSRTTTSFYTYVYWSTNHGTGSVPAYWYARGY